VSSKSCSPARADSSATVPSATVRPWLTTTTRSHSRSTSDMMCVENTMHLPSSSRSRRSASRSARVASTSRPLVGSSSTMLAGSCTSARASEVFMRSPWLKPSVRRSISGAMSRMRASWSARAEASAAASPCRRP
jgi:hypothetical protein